MKIVQLTSESLSDLRAKRYEMMRQLVDDESGSLLVLRGTYAGEDRQRSIVSYAVFTVFLELWERFAFVSWSYTFDADGLIFYIKLEEEGSVVKNVLIHYEDHHPIGFAINSEVFSRDMEISRQVLGLDERLDGFLKVPLVETLDSIITDPKYTEHYTKNVEGYIVKGDKQTILSNILTYGYVSAFTKPMGFGMYGPNYRGSNDYMNFEKFIYFIRSYRDSMKRYFARNDFNHMDLKRFQTEMEEKIQMAVLVNQQSFNFTVSLTSIVIFAFINSRGYADITNQIKVLSDSLLKDITDADKKMRHGVTKNGMKEVFVQYVPFMQKHKSVTATLLYIMSRHDDQSVILYNGEQNLLKLQFLAKNLVFKKDKWEELDRFCISGFIYPQDSTVLLATTCMLDLMQRYYIKIKMLFDSVNS